MFTMKKIIILLNLLYTFSSCMAHINAKSLIEAIEEKLNVSNINLSPSIHGGDNIVFFIKKDNDIIGIAKCYTKRTLLEVEKIYQLSDELGKKLPIPKIFSIFLHDQRPIVLQSFLPGQHHECLNTEQLGEIAQSMAEMHKIKLQNANLLINSTEFDYNDLLKLCSCFSDFDYISRIYRSLNLQYLNNLPLSVIHGDFSGSNILFMDNKISGIIDMDHARYSFRLTDIARAQVFFSFNSDGTLNEDKIKYFLTTYKNSNELFLNELKNFYDHLKLLLIKMVLETYYYVEVKKEVSPEIFKKSSFNQSWQLLLKKLRSLENKSSIIL